MIKPLFLETFCKTKSKKVALSFYRAYDENVSQNFSKYEFIALQNFSKDKDLNIQKSDRTNSVDDCRLAILYKENE